MKKMVAKAATVLMVATMLSGCSGGRTADNASTSTTKKEESTTVTSNSQNATDIEYWTFQELHVEFYEEMASLWNEHYPDRQINLKSTALPYDDMHSKLLIALQAGVGAPELVDIEIGKFANYLKGDPQLLPLNDIIEPELDNIVKARVDIYSKDDKYYGICFHIGASVMYYNMDILNAAGVNVEDIVTWDDFEEAGKQVLEKTGKMMTTAETNDPWSLWPMIASAGGDLLKEDGSPDIDSAAFLQATTFVQNMIKEGIAITAPGGGHHAEEYYGFMDQEGAAAVSMPLWYMGRFTDYMPDLEGKILIAPNPVWEVGEPRSVGLGGTGTAVTNQAKDPQLTKDFLAFCKLSNEGNVVIWEKLGFDIIREEAWDLPEIKAPNKFTDFFLNSPFDVLGEIRDEILPITVDENLPKVMDAMKTTVLYRLFEDLEDPAKVLAEEEAKLK